MSDNASNQGKAVVTEGTKHVAQNAGPTDPCFNPAASPQIKPFQNHIKSTELKKYKTRRTKIGDKSIMTARTYIGPDSEGDEEPYTLGAMTGQPYNNWAKAASWSRDVKAEGWWLVRTDDATTQNTVNSRGTMDGSQLDGDETTVREYAETKCTMNKLEGTSGEKKPKKLWKKYESSEQFNYIEILTGESVELVSERIDATDITGNPKIDPACELVAEHTVWRVRRTGGGVEEVSEDASGKTYTVGGALTDIGGASWKVTAAAGAPTDTLLETDARKVESTSGTTGEIDVGALLAFLRFRSSPCMIRADAIACAGPKTAWIRLFPKEKVSLKLAIGTETQDTKTVGAQRVHQFLESIYNRLGFLRALCNKIARVVGLAGDIDFEFKVFEGFEMELEMEYKHCDDTLTTRLGDWRSSEAHVGLAYQLKLSSAPLIEFGVRLAIPVVTIAAAFFTGPGATVVTKVMRKIEDILGDQKEGARFDLEFHASISVGLSYQVSVDQHVKGDFAGTMEIKPQLTISLVVALASCEARAGATLEGTVTVGTALPPSTHFLRLTSEGKVDFKLWVSGKVSGRVLWIGPRYEFSGRRDFKIFEWEAWKGDRSFIEVAPRATS